MSDELFRELEQDLQREKQKVFFQKYKFHILSAISAALVCVGGYQLVTHHQEKKIIEAANNYKIITQNYTDIEKLTDNKKPHMTLSKETRDNVPEYTSMVRLTEFNALNLSEAPDKKKYSVLKQYINNKDNKNQSINDSIVWTHYLTLSSDIDTIPEFEKKLDTYLKHPFAFKMIGYELAFLNALKHNNPAKSLDYLRLLEQFSDERTKNKVLLYKTHPLIVKQQTKDANDKNTVLQKNKSIISQNKDKNKTS